MQKLLVLVLAVIALSCNNAATTSAEATKDSVGTTANVSAAAVNYPYSIERPDNWEIGNSANTLTALSALKAWEEGKIDESMKYFADSVHLRFDAVDKKMPSDSVKAFFTGGMNFYKNVKLKVTDWESVISKDKSEEWVTVWYTQFWDTKGGRDSVDVVNDLKLKDGKIVRLDEYMRKLHD